MFIIPAKDRVWEINKPQIMGIINATPDSFYDKSRKTVIEEVLSTVQDFISEGVNVVDIGGQSTRPGAIKVEVEEEMDRVLPIIEAIRNTFPALLISIDTYINKVAEKAITMGANIINDISCGQYDPTILDTIVKYNAGYIGMHIHELQAEMHTITPTSVNDLVKFFEHKKTYFSKKGIKHWIIDPGFGFGKSIEDNFKLVSHLHLLKTLDLPILLGVSRKSAIYKTLGVLPADSLNGTTVVNTIGLLNGAQILRVHDVKEAQQIIQLLSYLQ